MRAFLESLIERGWKRVGRRAVRADGAVSRPRPALPRGRGYRVIVPGPNVGSTYAPDAASVVDGPVELDPVRRGR